MCSCMYKLKHDSYCGMLRLGRLFNQVLLPCQGARRRGWGTVRRTRMVRWAYAAAWCRARLMERSCSSPAVVKCMKSVHGDTRLLHHVCVHASFDHIQSAETVFPSEGRCSIDDAASVSTQVRCAFCTFAPKSTSDFHGAIRVCTGRDELIYSDTVH